MAVLCVATAVLYPLAARLAAEMAAHGKLRKSHAALQKQAAGLSQEYARATTASPQKGATQPAGTSSTTTSPSQVGRSSRFLPSPLSHCSAAMVPRCWICFAAVCLPAEACQLPRAQRAATGLARRPTPCSRAAV